MLREFSRFIRYKNNKIKPCEVKIRDKRKKKIPEATSDINLAILVLALGLHISPHFYVLQQPKVAADQGISFDRIVTK